MKRYYKNDKITSSRHPQRESIIQHDEIISLMIDLHILTVEEFLEKHCFDHAPKEISKKSE